MDDTLSNKQLRKGLRKKGIPIERRLFISRMVCRTIARRTGNVHWVFREDYGYVILSLTTAKGINYARKKSGISKLRIRDMDRMCVFRFPRRGWMYNKKTNPNGQSKK